MGRMLAILSCFLNAGILLIQLCGAQLTGNITSPGNVFVVTISISNPTQQTISILKWNNVFDNSTQLPVSLAIEDDQGVETPIASTYVMRAGVFNSDLYSLAPGETYEKVLDLRQILQNLGSGGSGLQRRRITMSLPPSFQGIMSTGPIPLEANADLTTSPIRLGNFALAGLQDISVTSEPFPGSLDFPLFRLATIADPGPADGIQVHSSCAPPNATDSDAIFDAGIYAHSLLMAANDSSSSLYPQFFQDSMRQSVGAVASAAASTIHGNGPHVDLYCTDILKLCGDRNILGYTFAPSFLGNAYIVLCPVTISLGRVPEPCSTPPETQVSASKDHVLFHLILTLSNIIPTTMSQSIYGSQSCQQMLSNSTSKRINASLLKNADSYAQLAIAHWSYGLGGLPYTGSSCLPPDNVVPGNQKRESVVRSVMKERSILERQASKSRLRRQQPDLDDEYFLEKELAKVGACTGVEKELTDNALANARDMAALARDAVDAKDPVLWTKYFNGGIPVKQRVEGNFDKVATWNATEHHIGFLCDTQRRSAFCANPNFKANMIITLDHTTRALKSEDIVFCPSYFYNAPTLECLSPGLLNSGMSEHAGGLLHELLHSHQLIVEPWIYDGTYCYDYSCTVQYAHDRVLPAYPTHNLPEVVAKNYEYYAYAVRAKRTDCTWTEYVGSQFGLRPY